MDNIMTLATSGYFYSTDQATAQAAADAISTCWLNSIEGEAAYKAITTHWSKVTLAADGSGMYYTEKRPDDACNVPARDVVGILEGAGDINWLPVSE